MTALASLLLSLLPLAAGDAAGPDLPVAVSRVSDRVVVAQYSSNNVTAVATARGVLVIDSNRSPTIMRAILAALAAELGRDDWTWLVNTHGHWDHTWGNQVLAGTTRLGHELCAEYVDGHAARARFTTLRMEQDAQRARAEVESMDDDTPRRARAVERARALEIIVDDLHHRFVPTPPNQTFTDRTRIDGGDVTAELIFCGEVHTDHDVFVFVPEEGLLLTGDAFCSKNAPCFRVNALVDTGRLIGVIDEILERAPERLVVVPGHGGVMSRDDLVHLRAAVEERAADVRVDASAARRVADGQSLEGAGAEFYFDEEEFHALARRYLGRGRLDLALQTLELAIERLPDSALLHYILGETHFHMGNTAGARDHYERSLELEPQNETARRILELLEAQR